MFISLRVIFALATFSPAILATAFTLVVSIASIMPASASMEGSFPEDVVSDLKRKLLDAALESGVSVATVAYVDETGKLESSSVFSSKVNIRGVQVAAYLDALGVGSEPKVGDSVLEPGTWCEVLNSSGLSKPDLLALSIRAARDSQSASSAILSALIQGFESRVSKESVAMGYRLGSFAVVRGLRAQSTSSYRAFTLGGMGMRAEPDFLLKAEMKIQSKRDKRPTLLLNHPGASAFVHGLTNSATEAYDLLISLEASQPSSEKVLVSRDLLVPISVSRKPNTGEIVIRNFETIFSEIVIDSLNDLQKSAHCMPRTFNVARKGDEIFELDAGLIRGVNVGDWLIIADRRLLVGNLVSDRTINSLSVLKVTEAKDVSAIAVPIGTGINPISDGVYVGITVDEGLLR